MRYMPTSFAMNHIVNRTVNSEYQKATVKTSNLECYEIDHSISKKQAIQIFPTAHGATSKSCVMTNLSRQLPGITSSSFASV